MSECVYDPWPELRCLRIENPKPRKWWCYQCAGNDATPAPAIVAPKPPTLREWLGARVSELGPWAEVLREQPVPAGHIRRWEWRTSPDGWYADGGSISLSFIKSIINPSPEARLGYVEAFLMALFTRHPDVKPEPRKAEIVCEDQHEVMP